MKEPGKLLKLANMSSKEKGQLADLLDNLSGTNSFRVLENFLGDKFLPFLDILQGEELHIPSISKILIRADYLKIYNDSYIYELDYLAKKYKKNPSVINTIIHTVHEELKKQGGDILEEMEIDNNG
jgi:hypothetical protein